ncbi:hypothetical protein [Micromonospora carbonacea]|uniref:Secreted protein n=1 Tax=Micromonospora carbonacea TaxID=47853 RepID=A0A1C5AFJ3_9ACTN|nr:hypothetical protein [Micromonospora carbonacea]SCF43995.1 hypothetical protein GA0070563_112325 [Micromonospora carbonacea]
MRVSVRIFGVGVASAALLVASPMPAMAEDGPVYARVWTYPSGGSGEGGETRADLNFTSARSVTYNNWTINDICPGDNYRVIARARAQLRDGSWANGTWHEDDGTCDSDAWGPYDGKELNTSRDIMKAGLQVCVDLGPSLKCEAEYRDNGHTS